MSDGQKVIKYLAIAFAIFLSVNIIIGIISAVFFGIRVLDINFKENNKTSSVVSNYEMIMSQKYENVEKLKIEIGYSKLEIKQGEEFKVESNAKNENIKIRKTSNTLTIKEENTWNIFNDDIESHIIITVPKYYFFEKIDIDAGSSELNISDIQTKSFDIDVGAGNVIISNLLVIDKADIDGGAGKVVINNSNLSNLDLDVGVGEFQILNSKLLENSDIDSGIGKLQISLKGTLEDYKIIPTTGIGSFTIEGNTVENDKVYGNGENKIKIDAGIGKVEVDFVQ